MRALVAMVAVMTLGVSYRLVSVSPEDDRAGGFVLQPTSLVAATQDVPRTATIDRSGRELLDVWIENYGQLLYHPFTLLSRHEKATEVTSRVVGASKEEVLHRLMSYHDGLLPLTEKKFAERAGRSAELVSKSSLAVNDTEAVLSLAKKTETDSGVGFESKRVIYGNAASVELEKYHQPDGGDANLREGLRWLQLVELTYPPDEETDSKEYAELLGKKGQVKQDLGDTAGAVAAMKRSLRIFQKLGLGDSEEVIVHLSNLGLAYESSGDVRKAEDRFRGALALCDVVREGSGEPHMFEFAVVNNLAALLSGQAQTDEDFLRVDEHFLRALRLAKDEHGEKSLEVANLRSNRGAVFQRRSYYCNTPECVAECLKEAEGLARSAVAIGRKYYSKHYLLGEWLNTLGVVLSREGRLKEALERQEEAVELGDELPRKRIEVAVWKANFAATLSRLGKMKRAEQEADSAVTYAESLGPREPRTADVLQAQAYIKIQLGKHVEAAESLSKCVRLRRFTAAPGDDQLSDNLVTLGYVYQGLEQHRMAENAYVEAYNANIIGGRGESLEQARLLNNMAALYIDSEDLTSAESRLKEALKILSPAAERPGLRQAILEKVTEKLREVYGEGEEADFRVRDALKAEGLE